MRGRRSVIDNSKLTERLLSRKFFFSLGAFATLVFSNAFAEAASVVIAFVAVEGAIDWKNGA